MIPFVCSHTLAQYIWEAIPVAFLPPAHRHTVDITCGQRAFLSAGASHLAGLTDMREQPITDYLHDDHAALAQDDPQPGIIVGTLHDANSHATTDAYLQQVLHQLRPGGYLALVMPRTLLTTDTAPWMHTGVHAAYDILEVWYLTTTGMTPPMVVLIAQKSATHVPAARPVRVRTVQHQPTADTATVTVVSSRLGLDQTRWDMPPTQPDPRPDQRRATYHTSGEVVAVHAHAGTVTLWIRGFADEQTVTIDPIMPGWLLRPDTPFRALMPAACTRQESLESVVWGPFAPQNYTYLTDAELEAQLAAIFTHTDGPDQ